MKKTELRIGNLIILKGTLGAIFSIETIEKDFCSLKSSISYSPHMPFDSIEGIKLTEEWLQKLGFKQWGSYKHLWKTKQFGFTIIDFGGRYYLNEYGRWKNDVGNMKYVHQLQNLYFALTGQELTPVNNISK